MKKMFVGTLALFTVLSLGAFAQDAATSGKTTTKKSSKAASTDTAASTKTAKAGSKAVTGTISADGKSITNDADQSSWTISNPDKVKGHEGHHVRVRGKLDDSAKSIDVSSVTMVAEKGAAKKSTKAKKEPGSTN